MPNIELVEKLKQMEETLLIDLLGLNSTQIVEAFLDLIEENFAYLYEQVKEKD